MRARRGDLSCNDVLIAVVDGLKGMGEALAVLYPATTRQTCIVHLIRNRLDWTARLPLPRRHRRCAVTAA